MTSMVGHFFKIRNSDVFLTATDGKIIQSVKQFFVLDFIPKHGPVIIDERGNVLIAYGVEKEDLIGNFFETY